jgi:NAD(P)-dependent dehydrogenase (short-subunit alcohol dehydrogenase family)
MTLKGQKIVVVGGSSGIGEATTRLLSENGASLIVTSRTQAALDKVQRENSGVVATACFDFADEDAVKEFFDGVETIDHLVIVAAGYPGTAPLSDPDFVSGIRAYFDQKFWGVIYVAKHGIAKVKKGGSVVFFIGEAGRNAYANCSPVAAVNCAITGVAKTLAAEIAPTRVNVLCPGLIDTPVYDSLPKEARDDMYAKNAADNPVGRMGKPDDIASGVLFLITNGYVNGTVLDISGGQTIDKM